MAGIVTKQAVASQLAIAQMPALIRTVRSALAEFANGDAASGWKKSQENTVAFSGDRSMVSNRQLVEGIGAEYQVAYDAMPTEEDSAKVWQEAEKLEKEHSLPEILLTGESLLTACRGLAAFAGDSRSRFFDTVAPAFPASELRAHRLCRCPCQVLPSNPVKDGRQGRPRPSAKRAPAKEILRTHGRPR